MGSQEITSYIIGPECKSGKLLGHAFWSITHPKLITPKQFLESKGCNAEILFVLADKIGDETTKIISKARGMKNKPLIVVHEEAPISNLKVEDADWLLIGHRYLTSVVRRIADQARNPARRVRPKKHKREVSLLANSSAKYSSNLLKILGFKPVLNRKFQNNVVFVSDLENARIREKIPVIKTLNARLIGFDVTYSFKYGVGSVLDHAARHFDAGVDIFIDTVNIDIRLVHRFVAELQQGADPSTLMYAYVGSSGSLERRAKQTADTKKELRFLIRQLKRYHCKTIFDGGCGAGRLAIPLAKAGFRVIGGDISEQLLSTAKELARGVKGVAFCKTDLRRIPYSDESFDAVILLWHVIGEFSPDDQRRVLLEAVRILKPPTKRSLFRRSGHGILIIDTPDESNPYVHEARKGRVLIDHAVSYHGKNPSPHQLEKLFKDLQLNMLLHKVVTWGIKKHVYVLQRRGRH